MNSWLEPGIIVGILGILLAFMGKVTSNIDAIKKGAVSGANLDNSLKNLQTKLAELKDDVEGVKKIITNGLSSKVNEMSHDLTRIESAQKIVTLGMQTHEKEIAEIKTRCEERIKWVPERSPGRREYDNDICG